MRISVLLCCLLLLSVIACTKNAPYLDRVSSNPAYLVPAEAQQKSDIIFFINNPTTLNFNGIAELRFNDKCLQTFYKEKQVAVKNNDETSYTISINAAQYQYNSPSLGDDCYKEQKVTIILENNDKSVVYDTKEVGLTIARS